MSGTGLVTKTWNNPRGDSAAPVTTNLKWDDIVDGLRLATIRRRAMRRQRDASRGKMPPWLSVVDDDQRGKWLKGENINLDGNQQISAQILKKNSRRIVRRTSGTRRRGAPLRRARAAFRKGTKTSRPPARKAVGAARKKRPT